MDSPNADKLNFDVDRKRLLERLALLPSDVICPRIHFVRKRHLLVVIRWKQSHFVYHACERTSGKCTPRKAEYAYFVSALV